MRSPELEVDGAKVKARREAAGLFQQELADKLGVTRSAITQWESGFSQPNAANYKRLCKVLGVAQKSLLVVSDDQAA